MNPEEIAELFTALRGGEVRDLARTESGLQMKVILPKIAAQRDPAFRFFYCTLIECTTFSLQPFRNASTVIDELATLERLELVLGDAQAVPARKVKVDASHRGANGGARLTVCASAFKVYDEAFDAVSAAELEALRPEQGLTPLGGAKNG